MQLGNEILEGSHAVPAIPSAPERRFVIFFEESSVQGAGEWVFGCDRAGHGSIERRCRLGNATSGKARDCGDLRQTLWQSASQHRHHSLSAQATFDALVADGVQASRFIQLQEIWHGEVPD